MFKSLTDFIHRLPWWGVLGTGFLTLIALVLLAIPYNVILLHSRGDTPAQQRTIQREIDAAMGRNGLGLAERVVRTIQTYASDPVRQAELQRALDEIARARREIDSGARDIKIIINTDGNASGNEAEISLREAEFDAAMAAYEASVNARQAVEDSLEDVRRALKDGGIPESEWPKTLDARAGGQRETEAEAKRRVDEARERLNRALDKASELESPQPPVAPAVPAAPAAPADKVKKPAPAAPEKPHPAELAKPSTGPSPLDAASVGAGGEARALGEGVPDITVDIRGVDLPAELKSDIASAVGNDFSRAILGAILLLLFIPLFMVLVIAKFFVDRARGAQQIAEEKSTEAEQQSLQRQITEARLQALQAQVEPHFLYNTLANVQALIEFDPPAAGTMVGHLIDYLRAALPKMRESQSTVAQELELARAYLNILKMRMGSRMDFSIEADPAAAVIAFPPLMLPSLVENAIKHGLEPKREGGRIEINARVVGTRLVLSVRDSGRGLPTVGSPATDGSGVGLANIRERLLAMHGSAASLTLEEIDTGGVEARIELPLETVNGALQPKAVTSSSSAVRVATPELPPPATIAGRLGRLFVRAHDVWRKIISGTFAVLMALMLLALLGGVVGTLTGAFPLQFGDVHLEGPGGIALGLLGLLTAFGVLSLVLALLVGILYFLGFVFAFVLLIVPFSMLVGMAPVLAPLVILCLLIYWLLKKRDQDAVRSREMRR